MVKNLPANAEDITDVGSTLGQEGPLEEGLATHSSILAWRVSWTEEPGRLWAIGSQRVGHDRSNLALAIHTDTHTHKHTHTHTSHNKCKLSTLIVII